ncbi:uncharacterized protein [Euwallacea fornicatus]|uniref:uncharacterized protein n=1 Tax=Euwallacea fornicatus TaxID=995702 RepID=UPI00338F1817
MTLIRDLILATVLFAFAQSLPGGSYHHVHHRIHVPQKIKTIYHTKIIKVPEHHHHFHEKEKIIIEKEPPKIEHHPIIIKEKLHHHDDLSEFGSSDFYKRKRNAPLHEHKSKVKKRRVLPHRSYEYHKH